MIKGILNSIIFHNSIKLQRASTDTCQRQIIQFRNKQMDAYELVFINLVPRLSPHSGEK